jgi:hypothetical protein
MRKGASLFGVASFVLALLGSSLPAMASSGPEFIYVRTKIYLKVVDFNRPYSGLSITRDAPTVKGIVKMFDEERCVLEALGRTFDLTGCTLKNDEWLPFEWMKSDSVAFTISNSELLRLTESVISYAAQRNHATVTNAALAALEQAKVFSTLGAQPVRFTNIYQWDGVDADSRLSAMVGPGSPDQKSALVISFDLSSVSEYNRPTR